MSSGSARKRGEHVGFAMLAMVSLAIFAAQLQLSAERDAPADEAPIMEVVELAGSSLKSELVEVATDEPQHTRFVSESDGTDRGGRRDPF